MVFDFLSNQTPHPQLTSIWNSSGFTVINEMDLHIASEGKIQELQRRTVDPNAYPCIIPVIATSEINSNGWQALKKQLETNNIKFLQSMDEAQRDLEDSGEFFQLTSEQLADKLAPYGQTDLLIQECISLTAEYRNGLVRLQEPRSYYKDRAVVLAYANLIAEKLDNKFAKEQEEIDYSLDNLQLVW